MQLTRQEQWILIFIMGALILGTLVRLYRYDQTNFSSFKISTSDFTSKE